MKLNTKNKKTREINSMKVQRRTSHSPTFDTHPKTQIHLTEITWLPRTMRSPPDTGSETSISTPHHRLFDTCLSMVDHESSDDVCFEGSLHPSAVWSMALIVGSRKVEANKLEASSNLGSVLRGDTLHEKFEAVDDRGSPRCGMLGTDSGHREKIVFWNCQQVRRKVRWDGLLSSSCLLLCIFPPKVNAVQSNGDACGDFVRFESFGRNYIFN